MMRKLGGLRTGKRIGTLIGRGSTFDGHLISTDGIRVDGKVIGRVDCDGCVVVGREGVVEADINSADIVINGEVAGNVRAERKIEITEGGKMSGDITSPSVVMAEGVTFQGLCNMTDVGVSAKTPAKGPKKVSRERAGKSDVAPEGAEKTTRDDGSSDRIERALAKVATAKEV
ncbi:polymer-forming cytoskeletal protein [Thermodesulfobacteriota bacterium]